MSIDNWIESLAEKSFGILYDNGEPDGVIPMHIVENEIRELLKTHAIVPREPSDSVINAGVNVAFMHLGDAETRMRLAHKAIIEAAEQE